MRVKFDKRIYSCTVVTHPKGSKLLLFTTQNGVYTVDVETCDKAELIHIDMLTKGYCDISQYEYSN